MKEQIYIYRFFQMLVVLFIGLKLTGYIDWHWVWVFSPFWIIFCVGIINIIIKKYITWKKYKRDFYI